MTDPTKDDIDSRLDKIVDDSVAKSKEDLAKLAHGDPIAPAEIAYYVRRLENRVRDAMVGAVSREIREGRTSRSLLAKKINVRPAQITRWLREPTNYRLDVIARMLIGIGAEMDPRVTFLRDRRQPKGKDR